MLETRTNPRRIVTPAPRRERGSWVRFEISSSATSANNLILDLPGASEWVNIGRASAWKLYISGCIPSEIAAQGARLECGSRSRDLWLVSHFWNLVGHDREPSRKVRDYVAGATMVAMMLGCVAIDWEKGQV